MGSFRDQKILITGGSSGIGKLMAETFAGEGARVILWSNERIPLEAVAKEFGERGLHCATYLCDVSRPYSIYDTAKRVLAEHGPIDILINNAGVVSGRPLLEIADAEIRQTFDVNALAPIWLTRAFLPAMIERRRGHIVTIASAAGLIGAPGMTDYAASKHAAVGFDDALRAELRHLGHPEIRTTVVCPYFISTGMFEGASSATPLLPILTPEYATRRIVRAIRRKRRRLLLPRSVILVYPMRLLPTPIFDWIVRALGITRSMDRFTGRRPG
ncbi:MAG: SDR family oxidoreductase [Deltaproteobacteria bacterium]|nr:SDR family oxidoreductase [Deltaproteobacteria bacterium]